MKLSDYILKTREERTAHIDLDSPCDFSGYRKDKSIILNFLGIEDDAGNWTKARIHRCHLCSNGRRKGDCSNPKHQYLGTTSENTGDQPPEARKRTLEAASKAKRKPLTLQNIESGELFSFSTQHEAARVLGLHQNALSGLVNGGRKTHKGYRVHSGETTP